MDSCSVLRVRPTHATTLQQQKTKQILAPLRSLAKLRIQHCSCDCTQQKHLKLRSNLTILGCKT
jgi:hypothetical protein